MKKKRLGFAFSDELLKTTQYAGHFRKKKRNLESIEDAFLSNFDPEDEKETISPWKLIFLACFLIIVFFGLFLRIFHLQVVKGEENKQRADVNRIQMQIIHAPRGVIYDRNDKILAQNTPGFRMEKQLLSRDQALEMEVKNDPNFNKLEIDSIRNYPYGEVTSHILGYVGQISEEELKLPKYQNYKIGDRVGRDGIEQVYEDFLKGKDGAEIIEIDASGKKLGVLRRIEPIPGKDIYLSIDMDLQKVAYEALKKGITGVSSCCGAVVVENPQTGEILSLVSLPSYNGNDFTSLADNEKIENYFKDPNSPFLNRVISGTYPPGSTFKITSALAGLSSEKITPQTTFEDTGIISVGIWTFSNWFFTQNGGKDGWVDLQTALKRSNDIYFYRVGEKIGEEILGQTAKKLGFGKKLGIDLPGEADGLIPNDKWKRENINVGWYPGDTLHMAIGQGFLLATPLQILAQTSFMASDGKLIQPHLVTKITTFSGDLIKQFNFDPIVKDIFKKEDLEAVKSGLNLVPKTGGTAWPFFNFSVPTAGKTGTAEFGPLTSSGFAKTHAWYTTYAPIDDPKIAITVLVEGGGEGSTVAAPIAHDIYTWYFNTDKGNIKSLDTGAVDASVKQLGE
ncbi:MAG: penicillin-binding protein 2 [Candidatus Daviesbacteria bacterium]|nr:penicillin-binding protein 2 [Candidatus Daviesbacteria bacterium]